MKKGVMTLTLPLLLIYIKIPNGLLTVVSSTVKSDKSSKELKKRGMSFVGSKIMYAYMQAIGLVDDHLDSSYISSV